jgi:hypothetical protein
MIVYAACLTALTLAGMAGAAAMWAIRAGHIPRTFAAVALTGAGLILALESSSLSGQTLKSVFAIYFALLAVAYGALWLLLRTIRFSATATGLPPLTPGIEPPAIPVIPTADTAAVADANARFMKSLKVVAGAVTAILGAVSSIFGIIDFMGRLGPWKALDARP